MGCLQSCFLHCIKRCGCCICDCCFGLKGKAFCTLHETSPGKTVFNGPFDLILYDKWIKQTELYQNRVAIFKELQRLLIPNKNVVEDQVILDVGCGTGAFTEVMAKALMLHASDTMVCLDASPQCIHYVRTRVVEKLVPRIVSDTLSRSSMSFSAGADLEKLHFEYFCNNDARDDSAPDNALCIDSNYGDNDISIAFMSLVLNHVSVRRGDRHCLMKQLFSVLKPNGAFVLFEFGIRFMQQFTSDAQSGGGGGAVGGGDNEQLLTVEADDDTQHGFASSEALQRYVEGYGFTLETRIMEDTFGDDFWLFVFRKPESAVI